MIPVSIFVCDQHEDGTTPTGYRMHLFYRPNVGEVICDEDDRFLLVQQVIHLPHPNEHERLLLVCSSVDMGKIDETCRGVIEHLARWEYQLDNYEQLKPIER